MKNKILIFLLFFTLSIKAQTPNYTATRFPNGLVPPSRNTAPILSPGSLWHDVVANAMKWYNGTQWVTIGSSGGITTETDPTVPANVKAITATNISNWNSAFGWANHASAGYATTTQLNTKANTSSVPIMIMAVASGNGASTTISIPHGQTGVTSSTTVQVGPRNAASAGIIYWTSDATNVNIIYTVAPVSGTNNLSYTITIKP